MPGTRKDRPSGYRFAGMGFDFFAAVAGFTVVGYFIGRYFQRIDLGVLIGSLLGVIGGGYNFLKTALKAAREVAEQDSPGPEQGKDDGP